MHRSLSVPGVALACLLGFAALTARGVNNDWTNSAGGEWENTGNWSQGRLPLSNDDVRINASGTYTVHIGNNAADNFPGSFSNRTFYAHNAGGRITIDVDYTNGVSFPFSSAYLDPGPNCNLGDVTLNWNTTNALTAPGRWSYMNQALAMGTQAVMNVYSGSVSLLALVAANSTTTQYSVINVYTGGYVYLSGRGRLGVKGTFQLNVIGGRVRTTSVAYGMSEGIGRLVLVSGSVMNSGADAIYLGGASVDDSRFGGYGQMIVSNGTVYNGELISVGSAPGSVGDFQLIDGTVTSDGQGLIVGNGTYGSPITSFGYCTGTLTIAGGSWSNTANSKWIIGRTSNTLGRVTVTGGTVMMGRTWVAGTESAFSLYRYATGEIVINGGVMRMRPGGTTERTFLCLGSSPYGVGRLTVNGGALDMSGRYVDGGLAVGSEVYTWGANNVVSNAYSNDYIRAEVVVESGSITAAPVAIGRANGVYPSTFSQYGGIVRISRADASVIPEVRRLDIFKSGTYTFKGGILNGGSGSVVRVLGGTFRGYGDVLLQSKLFNDGRVIADGLGTNGVAQDRSLLFTNLVAGVTNGVENTASNGWFAINQGKLTLPNVAVAAGNTTVNWGETTNDATIDLVNSAQVVFTGASAGGLSGSLCATNRTDLSLPSWLIKPIGIWQFELPSFTTAAVTFRYDDAAAAAAGLSESSIQLFAYSAGSWNDVTGSRNLTDKTITSTAISAPATLFVLGSRQLNAGTIIIIR